MTDNVQTRCVNDTNGDGDCAACARNPNAPCRVPVDACTDCRLVGRCAAHPMRGWLVLRDVSAEFRELYGDEAEKAARAMSGRALPAHDWRFMVEYGPHPAGDRRNGRVTFHDGADAAHVIEYLAREAITLEPLTAVERVDSACCGGTGYADYAAVRCPAPDCPVPEAQWRAEVASALPADPYAHLTADERHTLAAKARDVARSIALTAGLLDQVRFDAAIERSKRWEAIADELETPDD